VEKIAPCRSGHSQGPRPKENFHPPLLTGSSIEETKTRKSSKTAVPFRQLSVSAYVDGLPEAGRDGPTLAPQISVFRELGRISNDTRLIMDNTRKTVTGRLIKHPGHNQRTLVIPFEVETQKHKD